MKNREDIYEFMNSYTLGVVSTINDDDSPSAAIVGFGQTKDLHILIGTDNSSRKYKNMKLRPKVAFTLGGNTDETIQINGSARELLPEELHIIKENYWLKNPHAEVHSANPGERYFIITPTWLRYTDLRVKPWDITELQF